MRSEDRVLFVGDVKQPEAVDAGSPFAQFGVNKQPGDFSVTVLVITGKTGTVTITATALHNVRKTATLTVTK